MPTKIINVKFIHERRPRFKDNFYGTGLEWKTGEQHPLPEPVALKFLRHEDSFEDADNPRANKRSAAAAANTTAALRADAAAKLATANKAIETANAAIADAKEAEAKAIAAEAKDAAAIEAASKAAKTEAETAAEVEQAEKAKAHEKAEQERQALEKAEQERQALEQQHHEMLDSLERCATKQSLIDFAKQRFQVDLDAKHTLPELRVEAKNLVDRFGMP